MNLDEVKALSNEELRGWAWTLAYCDHPTQNMVGNDGFVIIDGEQVKVPDYPNENGAAMGLAEIIGDRYWLELHTPFCIGEPYFAGFTPLSTTGWNGVPDNKCPGDKVGQAITRSFVLVMTQEAE